MRPDTLPSRKSSSVVKYLTPKNAVILALGLAGWHYADIGAIKDVSAAVRTVQQQVIDQDVRLNIQRESNQRKVDKDVYDRDIRDLRDRSIRLQESSDDIKRLLMERKS